MLPKNHRLLLLAGLVAGLMLGACASLSSGPIRQVGRLDTGTAYDVRVQGETAFIGNNDGLVIIDVHRPERPKKVATIDLGEAAFGICVEGDLAYITGGRDGFSIADVGDPANPRVLGSYSSGGAESVCVQDSVAYVSDARGELKALDVHDPANPTLLGSYQGGGMGTDVACHQGLVYFGVAQKGLVVLDVSDPSSPVAVATVGGTQGAKHMEIAGDRLYLGCHGNGARIAAQRTLHDAQRLCARTVRSHRKGRTAGRIAGRRGGRLPLSYHGRLRRGLRSGGRCFRGRCTRRSCGRARCSRGRCARRRCSRGRRRWRLPLR